MLSRAESSESAGRWRVLLVLSLVEVLAFGVWFSASAVVPALENSWGSRKATPMAHQRRPDRLRRRCALTSAALNLADRVSARILICFSALCAAAVNAAVALLANGLAVALPLRVLTGFLLAGVYRSG